MHNYGSHDGTQVRVEYGYGLVEGLRAFPETALLADAFESLNEELSEAYANRCAAARPVRKTSAGVRVADWRLDAACRGVWLMAQRADGNRVGPLTGTLFPDGLSPVVAPVGRRQIAAAEGLLDRLTRSRLPGFEGMRDELRPKLADAIATLKGAAERYQQSLTAYQEAYRVETACRDEHRLAVDRLIGEVRALFPGDRSRQDAIFPASPERRVEKEEATATAS